MKTVKINIDNSNIMSAIEKAHLRVTSPTKKTISIYKLKLDKATEEQRKIFWKFCKDPMVRFIGEMDATIEEMDVLLAMSKL